MDSWNLKDLFEDAQIRTNNKPLTDVLNIRDILEEMSYEKKNFINIIKRRMSELKRNKRRKKENIYTIRPLYLYLTRRRKWLYKDSTIYTSPPFEKVAYNKCIECISEIKQMIKKYENLDKHRKLWKYYKISLTTLRKYAKLHTYIDVIVTLSLRKKLNGNDDVCRRILSYI